MARRVSVGPTAGRFGPSRSSRRTHAHLRCARCTRTHTLPLSHKHTHTNVFLFHYLHFVYKNNVSLIVWYRTEVKCIDRVPVFSFKCVLYFGKYVSKHIIRLVTGPAIARLVVRGGGGRRAAGFLPISRSSEWRRPSSLQRASPHHMFHARNAVAQCPRRADQSADVWWC